MAKKRILVAVLNWGLGHATRCIPVIHMLLIQNFEPVIASDGAALQLLKKEFPSLEFHSLPSYNITYSKTGTFFGLKLLADTPHVLKTIAAEKTLTEQIVKSCKIDGIISDNRWGVHSKLVPSVFITHQVNVLSGVFTAFSSKIQQNYIKKFDQCWVPDVSGEKNLSGILGHPKNYHFPLKYLGVISRFSKKNLPIKYEILVILSGPEPQRNYLEKLLFDELQKSKKKILIVRGVVEEEQKFETKGNLSVYNFLTSKELEKMMNSSNLIISRSGYTTLLDLAKLEKMAFFIPTPGQYEQEYLARRLNEKGIFPSCPQSEFDLAKLENINNYTGLSGFPVTTELENVFGIFK